MSLNEPSLAVKSANRVLDLFELLACRSDGLSHTEIADALQIPKSSLTKLLQTVIGRGYIAYSPNDKHYRLGQRFTSIARQASRAQGLITQSQPILEELTTRTRESSALNLLKGDMAEVVATVSGAQRLISDMRLGDLAPLYATSGGKAILAHWPVSKVEQYLANVSFDPITPKTLSSVEDLRRQLDEVKRTGIAYSLEEFTPGIVGFAQAILSNDGEPLGSINVALPAVRYNPEIDLLVRDALTHARVELERRARL